MSRLFEPLAVGTTKLGHRVAMAPLTRYRMDDEYNPTPMSKEYYEQRACVAGTLIVSEATIIAKNAVGCRNAPGIWSETQIASWKEITDAVHAKRCAIFCQLWHQGRTANPQVVEAEGFQLVSSSAVPTSSQNHTPVAMTENMIWNTIEDYAAAAQNAMAAGFDGVEIHGANGYLPDQFLQSTCNQRTDEWGGSIEKRERYHLEVTKAVIVAIGSKRTAIRLSPYSDFNGMLMDEPEPTFKYLLERLKPLNLAYLHLIEARITGNDDSGCGGQKSVEWMVRQWENVSPVMLAGGFSPSLAKQVVQETYKAYDVLIAFGKYFVANPDLVFRVKEDVPLVKYDRAVFYTSKTHVGSIDYPNSRQYLDAMAKA